jgi:hypothetical protein
MFVDIFFLEGRTLINLQSFFSTTLVWFESESQAVQSSSNYILRVHQEIWIAVLTTFILTTTTFFVSSRWGRIERNTHLDRSTSG